MNSKRRLSQSVTSSACKLRLDSINKILKIDSAKKRKDKISKQISKVALSQLLKDASHGSQGLPDFAVFLGKKENIELFREFLKTQYCQENLDFYLACEKFRQLDHQSNGDILIQFTARQIFNDYLGENAKQPVNVNHECIKSIQHGLNRPSPNLFRDAQLEIFNLMRSDCYPRFCKTWKIDEGIARRILQTNEPVSNKSNDRADQTILTHSNLDSTIMSTNSTCTSVTRSSASARVAVTRKLQNLSNMSNLCPSNCPYFRLGLPCQTHGADTSTNSSRCEMRSKDLIDQIKLSRLHHVPKRRPVKTPPPPPLPPKQQVSSRDLAAPSLEEARSQPFIGKVFHV